MKQNDEIKELFAQKLRNQEAPVRPELWEAISSKVATTSVVSSATTVSKTLKVIITAISVASVTTIAILLNQQSEKNPTKTAENTDLNPTKENREPNSLENLTENQKEDKNDDQQTNGKKSYKHYITTKEKTYSFENNSLNTLNNSTESRIDDNNQSELSSNTSSQIFNKTNNSSTVGQQTNNVESKSIDNQDETVNQSQKEEEQFKTLPNVFTPNNDGENDFFWLRTKGLQDFSISILNDKNQVVYTSADPEFKWDGKDLTGSLLPQGTYIYYFTGKTSKGDSISKYNKLDIRY